ncbi:hypothetical protein CALVIDRAFT_49840 [Calocera viscosa TUFC12733]|uniref:Diphthine--ammonia ligase n=1 Tax=Calocera viscosa (strain TUFC12733) TaxID=1330018 RepID=A0A167NRE3_CALVF|nr:hypothetical protein CALVIDRAFT_49840 [Calocera viscosa TUFC12733]
MEGGERGCDFPRVSPLQVASAPVFLSAMKFVALLSGGKDSCYNIAHCHKYGHELLCAATLSPPHGKDEIDSFMYQTVGQDAIEIVAQALGIPLVRRIIEGQAVEQGSEYGTRAGTSQVTAEEQGVLGDETEDMFELLTQVKRQFPDVQAVSVGAILSSYQRVRVEHVCRRLGLTPLSYLWQRDQVELLQEMVDSGVNAILIKVAGIGLTPQHLGKSLAEMQPTLLKLHRLYGAHPCGEGGEYETLTLDCPSFRQQIELLETETVIHSDASFASVAYLRVKDARLIPKEVEHIEIPTPPMLSPEARMIARTPLSPRHRLTISPKSRQISVSPIPPKPVAPRTYAAPTTVCKKGHWLNIGNVQHRPPTEENHQQVTIEMEARSCFEAVDAHLHDHGFALADIAQINLFISSMDIFASVNAIYSTYFGTSPPTRACVAVDLPSPTRVRLDVLACNKPNRTALHVQGLSYWAPANIGPYSQAVLNDDLVFVSGQIALNPPTMTLINESLAVEAALSFQHLDRVVEAFQSTTGSWSGRALCAVCWTAGPEDLRDAGVLWRANLDHKGIGSPPVIFAAVKELPRGAAFEAQLTLHTNRAVLRAQDDRDDDNDDPEEPKWVVSVGSHRVGMLDVTWSNLEASDGVRSTAVFVRGAEGQVKTCFPREVLDIVRNSLSVRLFYTNEDDALQCVEAIGSSCKPGTTLIPCSGIATARGEEMDLALLCLM